MSSLPEYMDSPVILLSHLFPQSWKFEPSISKCPLIPLLSLGPSSRARPLDTFGQLQDRRKHAFMILGWSFFPHSPGMIDKSLIWVTFHYEIKSDLLWGLVADTAGWMPAAPGYCLWPNLRSSHCYGPKGPQGAGVEERLWKPFGISFN